MNCQKPFEIFKECCLEVEQNRLLKGTPKCNKCKRTARQRELLETDELCALTDCTSTIGTKSIADLIPEVSRKPPSKGVKLSTLVDLCDELGIDTSSKMDKIVQKINNQKKMEKSTSDSNKIQNKRDSKMKNKIDWNFEVMDLFNTKDSKKKKAKTANQNLNPQTITAVTPLPDSFEVQSTEISSKIIDLPIEKSPKIIRPIPSQPTIQVNEDIIRDSIAKLSELLTKQLMACSYL